MVDVARGGGSGSGGGTSLDVEDAILSRRSVRAFLARPVARETVERILDAARRAPSGTNMQPWKVRVVTGEPKRRLSEAVRSAYLSPASQPETEYLYYPTRFLRQF